MQPDPLADPDAEQLRYVVILRLPTHYSVQQSANHANQQKATAVFWVVIQLTTSQLDQHDHDVAPASSQPSAISASQSASTAPSTESQQWPTSEVASRLWALQHEHNFALSGGAHKSEQTVSDGHARTHYCCRGPKADQTFIRQYVPVGSRPHRRTAATLKQVGCNCYVRLQYPKSGLKKSGKRCTTHFMTSCTSSLKTQLQQHLTVFVAYYRETQPAALKYLQDNWFCPEYRNG